MPRTSAEITMDFTPLDIIDSTVSISNNNYDIGNKNNLLVYNSTIQNEYFATLEHNIFLLDGTYRIAEPSEKPYGYFGTEVSNGTCKLTSSKINITLKEAYDLTGITIDFGNDYFILSGKCKVTTKSGQVEELYIPSTGQVVFNNYEDVSKIEISFTDTKFPNMHPRINDLYLGLNYHFTEDYIVSLKLDEEISPISSVLPVNTAEATIYYKNFNFDILSNSIYFPLPKYNVSTFINCNINGKYINLGIFKLDSIENESKNLFKFKFVSLIKSLEDYIITPYGVYNWNLNEYLKYIFNNKFNFTFTNKVNTINVRHETYFKKANARDLLQQILFLYGIYTYDVLDGIFKIDKIYPTGVIGLNKILYPKDIIDDVKITRIEPINKVVVDTHDYKNQIIPGTRLYELSYTKVYDGDILKKIYIEFEKPANWFRYRLKNKNDGSFLQNDSVKKVIQTKDEYNNSIDSINSGFSGDYIQEGDMSWYYNFFDEGYQQHLLYTFHPSSDTINLSQYYIEIELLYYIESKNQYTIQSPNIKQEKLLHIDKPQIFSMENVHDFAKNTLEYYSNIDLKIELSYVFDGRIRVGDSIYLYIDNNRAVIATVVKQSIDAASGFISKITCIANSEVSSLNEFMSSDVDSGYYMNDNSLI